MVGGCLQCKLISVLYGGGCPHGALLSVLYGGGCPHGALVSVLYGGGVLVVRWCLLSVSLW